MFWKLLLGNHLRLAITTLVEVIFLALLHITWKLSAYGGGVLPTVVCHNGVRILVILGSTSKLLQQRRVTLPMQQMILIGMFPRLTIYASGRS
jgi:hypothetical protein